MNKIKAIKLLNQLRNNVIKDQPQQSKLYINSWVVGSIDNLLNKLNGDIYYPYRATYHTLFTELYDYLRCANIKKDLYDITYKFLINKDNLMIIFNLAKCI